MELPCLQCGQHTGIARCPACRQPLLTAPHRCHRQVDIASVAGGAIPWDAASSEEGSPFFTPEAQAFMKSGGRAWAGGEERGRSGLLAAGRLAAGGCRLAHAAPTAPASATHPAAEAQQLVNASKSAAQVLADGIEVLLGAGQGKAGQGGRRRGGSLTADAALAA